MTQSNPPPFDEGQSDRRRTIGQVLVFFGPLLFAGGILAIWRTGQASWFYAGLSVIGTIMWCAGAWIGYRNSAA